MEYLFYRTPIIKKVCVGIGSYGERANRIACGKITINGGTVIAEVIPEAYGAGIGSGVNLDYNSSAKCGDITINGGTVIATGAYGAAGIGSGIRIKNHTPLVIISRSQVAQ